MQKNIVEFLNSEDQYLDKNIDIKVEKSISEGYTKNTKKRVKFLNSENQDIDEIDLKIDNYTL